MSLHRDVGILRGTSGLRPPLMLLWALTLPPSIRLSLGFIVLGTSFVLSEMCMPKRCTHYILNMLARLSRCARMFSVFGQDGLCDIVSCCFLAVTIAVSEFSGVHLFSTLLPLLGIIRI
jgi:hypothetical protein